MKKLLVCLLAIIALNISALAHSGGVDANGGHYNRSTGEYHYHHGYPAHSHEGGVCPYDNDDRTGQSSGSSGSGGTSTRSSTISSIFQVLSKGARGDDVRLLQKRLAARGYDVGTIDGIFGAKTEAAVKEFQRANDMADTGVANSSVLRLLFPEAPGAVPSTPKPKATVRPATTARPLPYKSTSAAWKRNLSTAAIVIFALFGIPLVIFALGRISVLAEKIARFWNDPTRLRRREERKQRREHEIIVQKRQETIRRCIDFASNRQFLPLHGGLAYISETGEDAKYHNDPACLHAPLLVCKNSAISIGYVSCIKCSALPPPSAVRYAALCRVSHGVYHEIGSSCVKDAEYTKINQRQAENLQLKPCAICTPKITARKVWF